LSSHSMASFFTSLKIPLKQDLIDSVRKNEHLGPDFALHELEAMIQEINQLIVGTGLEEFTGLKTDKQRAKFLRKLTFGSMSLPEQRAWIEALAQVEDLRILRLRGCEALRDENFTGEPISVSTPPKPSLLERVRRKPKPAVPAPLFLPLIEVKNLRKLDVSGCNSLTPKVIDYILETTLALETLNLGKLNKISSLNLTTQSLKWLSVEGCSNLEDLKLKVPSLGTLIAKECSQLKTIEFDTIGLRILDLQNLPLLTDEMLDEQLQKCSKLQTLKLEGCDQISFKEVRAKYPLYPADILKKLSSVIQREILRLLNSGNERIGLNLSNTTISSADARAFALALQSNTDLTYLNLFWDKTGAANIQALERILKDNTTLTSLNLRGNKIGNEGVQVLALALKDNTTLKYLDLIANEIDEIGAQALALALKNNKTLTSLKLGHNKIGAGGMQALVPILHSNPTLTSLDLLGNKVGNEGLQVLALVLKDNTTLKSLGLIANEISDEGAQALASTLQFNITLTSLELNLNKIDLGGAQAFAKALQDNTTLTSLNLFGNQIDALGVQALAKALKKNTTLTSLVLEEDQIGDIHRKTIEQLLNRNRELAAALQASNQVSLESLGAYSENSEEGEPEEEQELESTSKTEGEWFGDFPSSESVSFHSSTSQASSSQEALFLDNQRSDRDADTLYVGLSLDGGGIYTYMTAYNLQKLEEYAGKPLYQLVDYIGGTSMGGVLALGLMASEDSYTPLWAPHDMMDLLTTQGSKIFPSGQEATKVWDLSEGLTSSCYPSSPFEKILKRSFRDLRFSDVLVPTLVTASRLYRKNDRIKSELHIFEGVDAQRNEYHDYFVRDVARAASAATGAFLPAFLSNVEGKNRQAFLDAGTRQNNPARLIHDSILRLYKQESYPATQSNIFILSMGAGRTNQWVGLNPKIALMMESTSEEIDRSLERLLGPRSLGGNSREGNYYRLNPTLDQAISMTDARPEVFEVLEEAARACNGRVEALARILAENRDRKHPASL
ncbi:MAG: patatin-like phospholipase family protein, partial [Candidatus Paracaedibacteraceae bacterium]|nr:patatin-like phospholipase family protein [Candidatus Paracaedibacteraceae bacterium]